jgi:hypothetical protein
VNDRIQISPSDAWEGEIDNHVYRLYGLTPDEIKIVEESVSDAGKGTRTGGEIPTRKNFQVSSPLMNR